MVTVLPVERWSVLERAHAARVDTATSAHLARRAAGIAHPVVDFLFTYYPYSPGRLRRWHPGAGVALAGAADLPRARWPHHRVDGGAVEVDVAGLVADRRDQIVRIRDILAGTSARDPQLRCFGLHEWAMVYRAGASTVRHAAWPLRLGADGTDAVVEANPLRCTHFDAFRFFTDDARPLNAVQPTRAAQPMLEQPGCLHAGMDLYRYAVELAPLGGSDLVMDCFDLASDLRELDMRAAPYDLRPLGYEPIPIETAEGRARYAAAQRDLAARAAPLRSRILDVVDAAMRAVAEPSG